MDNIQCSASKFIDYLYAKGYEFGKWDKDGTFFSPAYDLDIQKELTEFYDKEGD